MQYFSLIVVVFFTLQEFSGPFAGVPLQVMFCLAPVRFTAVMQLLICFYLVHC